MKKTILLFCVLLFSCSNDSSKIEFIRQSSLSNSSFRGLAVVDENVIWTTGSKGTVLKTSDGGLNWNDISPKEYSQIGFRDVHAWNNNDALIMGIGSPAIFLKTTDGGKTWVEVYKNDLEKIFFDSVEFWNDSCGVAFSDPIEGRHYLVKTDDYGNSWNRIDTNKIPKAASGEAAFAASGTCISTYKDSLAWFVSGGTEARVFYTIDQGNSWNVVGSPLISGLPTTGIYSVSFVDAKNGCIVGGDYTRDKELNANAAITIDGGVTWTLLKNKPIGFKSCVEYLPEIKNGIIATGTSGTDISYDLGKTWIQVDTTSFNTISFANNNTGWAVGDKGLIYKVIIKGNK